MKPYIIGIAGGSGSGKSTFASRLKEAFPQHISLISCDNYYLPHDELSLEVRAHLNYDAPEALEFDLMRNLPRHKHLTSRKTKKGADITKIIVRSAPKSLCI